MDSAIIAAKDDVIEGRSGPFRLFGIALVLAAVSLVLARGVAEGIRREFLPEWTRQTENVDRAYAIRDRLSSLPLEPENSALVFGSSTVFFDFSPEIFDETLREKHGVELTSYNFGLRQFNASMVYQVAKYTSRAYVKAGRKAQFVVLEFTPNQATQARRSHPRDHAAEVLMPSAFGTSEDFGKMVVDSRDDAALVAGYKIFGVPPGVPAAVLGKELQKAQPGWWPWSSARSADGEAGEVLLQTGKPWDARTRGESERTCVRRNDSTEVCLKAEGEPGSSQDDDARKLVVNAVRHYADPKNEEAQKIFKAYAENVDIVDLHFDEGFVQDALSAARDLKTVANRICVLVTPINPAWIKRPPAAEARLEAVLARFREQGVTTVDLSSAPEFTPDDFRDSTHLNDWSGKPKFSRLLADRLAVVLAAR